LSQLNTAISVRIRHPELSQRATAELQALTRR